MGNHSWQHVQVIAFTMICKYCKHTIEDDSIFCRFCGQKVVRVARRKPGDEPSIPAPKLTSSGRYAGRIMVNGERIYINEPTEARYYIEARMFRHGIMKEQRHASQEAGVTLRSLIEKYIDDNAPVLSPSTVLGYRSILNNNFPMFIDADPANINYQRMVSYESKRYSGKTVSNAWRLVTASLKYAQLSVPNVNLPKCARNDRVFLDFQQIQTFVRAARGDACEAEMLLALHSLRFSEILALRSDSFEDDIIHVRGAKVRSDKGYTVRDLNKTQLSTRDIPIMIPRLKEILPDTVFPISHSNKMLTDHIRKICARNALPPCTCHSLRHSFASLAYHLRWTEKSTMQIGGWSTPDVVNEVYTHLSSKDLNDDVLRMMDYYVQIDGT